MRTLKMLALVPAALLAVACGRNDAGRANDALQNDLALAAQAQPYMQQFNPAEAGYGQGYGQPGYNGYNAYGAPGYQTQRQPYYSPAPVRRTSSRSSSGGGGGYVYREPVRHTKRDAVIGAAAGAVLGASTSRDKVKGGIIGAAAGGILGGIIGHTIDVDH